MNISSLSPLHVMPLFGVSNDSLATEAFLIVSDRFDVSYKSKHLESLLEIPAMLDERNLFALLGTSRTLDAVSIATIATQFEQAKRGDAHQPFDILSSDRAPRTITVQIQRAGDTSWIMSFDDLGARQAAAERVMTLTLTDSLTGLGNRQQFRQSLTQAMDAVQPGADAVALILIDLDRFKAVNDTLGHPVGDELLRKVAGRLRNVIGKNDLLSRLGGDEFAAWLPVPHDGGDVPHIAARIIDMLGRPFLIEGMQVNIGASLGIARAPQDGTTYEQLVKNADLALYAAKAAGRNTFRFFDPKMEARAQERRDLELDLRRALALRQFELQYRPQIDAETRTLTGLEAMVRWRHPVRGLLEPEQFMPTAEEIGLVPAIGKWVLEAACQQATTWPDPVDLTVTIATPQFEAGSLVATLQQALAASQLPARRLKLDITETVLLRNEAAVVKTLHALQATGVGIGISNFGTGYASLAKLDSFPFDRIRLDTSLVTDQVASHRAIISAVVAFGTSLGVRTMVDGIRSDDDLARLRAGERLAVTGYLSTSPVSLRELDSLLDQFPAAKTALPEQSAA